jgi:hypothetical protein
MMAMTAALDPDHPKQVLLFSLEQNIDDAIRQKMKAFVEQLADIKEWINGPPCSVDTRQEFEDEEPLETVGGYIEVHSAHTPWKVPRDIDLRELQDVEVLVAALCQFSRENNLFLSFELNGDSVGDIDRGVMNEMLAEVLIAEWRRGLGLES